MTMELSKAREYEEKYRNLIPREERPAYHLSAPIGWLNDPNGFSVYREEYHLFFQYHPYSATWGTMHWGHAKTKDFIRWEFLPAALAPDMPYDREGCFSGSAVEMPDGRQLLCYTGISSTQDESGFMRNVQQQCIAVGDGRDYEKYEGNPVLSKEDLPEGCSIYDFRDPKIWREGDEYRMIVSSRLFDGNGGALIFKSSDGLKWTFVSTLLEGRGEIGRMWECPDYFRLDDEEILLISPMEMMPKGLMYHAGYGNVCIFGHMDPVTGRFLKSSMQPVDYGLDFYAMQTTESMDGRRIMIAWMQNWETSSNRRRDLRLAGEMTIPRELSIKDGMLIQSPVREIENYYGKTSIHRQVMLDSAKMSFRDIKGRILDLQVTIYSGEEQPFAAFRVYVAEDSENAVTIRYKPSKRTIRIDRSRCSFAYDIVNAREFDVREIDGKIKLRILLDRHSMELFVNDGEQTATSLIYAPADAQGISFESEGMAVMDVEAHELSV